MKSERSIAPSKRTRARALALVNWRGVFFSQYAMDPHVTALEGANGAGKTTVMIAAYVVMLPDMTRLRFTNLGESGATGGDRGIWGRLGEPGRPSYAVMDLELGDGTRMLAGVMLERRSEPTVEPTPFVVHGLPAEVGLSEVLLERKGEVEIVPELDTVRALVQAAGGKLKVFSSAKDYFAELFDRGVLPLRMQVDEERTKLNEMLRTSMVGGISRALTGGMREFLLREESGLADVLRRMRGNLEACRRTRREVEEARRLEGEIHSVWAAGQGMFAAVVHATRAEAEEKQQALEAARKRAEESATQKAQIERELEGKRARSEEIQARRAELRAEVQEAMARVERARRAWEVARRLARLVRDRDAQEAARVAEEALDAEAQAQREAGRGAWDRAREALGAAGRGVADLKAGLEELERRAAEHRLAVERLQQVRAALVDEQVEVARLGDVAQRVQVRIAAIDEELVKADRMIASGALQRAEYERVHKALEALSGLPVLSAQALDRAREVLAELRALDSEMQLAPELTRRLEAAQKAVKRQNEARDRARLFGALASSAEVQRALEETELAEAHVGEAAKKARETADESARKARDEARVVSELEPIALRHQAVKARVGALVQRLGHGAIGTVAELVAFRRGLDKRRDGLRSERERDEAATSEIERELDGLGSGVHEADAALMMARDAVGGELLAGRFEELPMSEAGVAEAALGPLRDAIAVEEPVGAAKKLAKVAERPDEVWLVGPRAALPLDDDGTPYAERVEDSVLLEMNGVVRLTRVPAAPRLGRVARERRKVALEERLVELSERVAKARDEERKVEAALSEIDEIMPEAGLIERADPAAEVALAKAQVAALSTARQAALGELQRAGQELEALERRRAGLRKLLPEAHYLDLVDQAGEARALEERLAIVRGAEARLRAAAGPRRTLEMGLEVLRSAPPSEAEVSGLKERREGSARMRDRLQQAFERVRWLGEHKVALEWTDAEPALAAREQLRPALEAQLKQAEAGARVAEAEVRTAETRARTTAEAAARAAGLVIAADQQIEAARKELGEAGVEAPGQRTVEIEEARLAELEGEGETLEQAERESRAQVVRGEERHRQVSERATEEAWRLAEEERGFGPAQARWARLREEASAKGVLAAAFSEAVRKEVAGLLARELWPRAKQRAMMLSERIGRAPDGAEVADALREHLDGAADSPGAVEGWLAVWLRARDWLRRRVPPQIAEVDEPLEALGRLREHLVRLEERLEAQEKSLRGQSGDVARNIDAQIRRAKNQVGRLNTDLEGVKFGAIEGMQIRVRPAQRTEAVLRALREGAAQQLLFEPNLPIEEAMDELFRRYGGGRSGGDRLLDYREYLDLQVEIRRRGATAWEVANPTRLSTGEAIGVGAAVMMATLKAWEAEANLLRPRHLAGTLRLLFLDEATRLSQDNLGILFELCERLELQLLIAAPEVARAEGNTTYRLVRALDAEGREEVRVSGRRVMAQAEAEALMARPADA